MSLLVIALIFGYQKILNGAAGYLAPSEEEQAEVVILEGTQVVLNGALTTGKALVSKGAAFRLVIVLHQTSKEEDFFALPADYPQLVKKELERSGLKRDQWQVLVTPVSHPFTQREAQFVLAELARSRVRRAILVSEGFHTRRSMGVYQKEGKKFGIKIIPHPYFISYQKRDWWLQEEGVRAFATEYLKLGYYLVRGYL